MSCEYKGILGNYIQTGFRPIKLGINFKPEFEFIKVICYLGGEVVYTDLHAFLPFKAAKLRPNMYPSKAKNWNVFLFGTDCLSHSASIRHLKKNRHYLKEDLEALEFQGYNAVGPNTSPNLLPLWTGLTKDEALPNTTMRPDHLPFIYKNYSQVGYKTLYAEDSSSWTMNYNQKSFKKPPTDYYSHPLMRLAYRESFVNYTECDPAVNQYKSINESVKNFIIYTVIIKVKDIYPHTFPF